MKDKIENELAYYKNTEGTFALQIVVKNRNQKALGTIFSDEKFIF